MTMLPPNPADLATEHAAALAEVAADLAEAVALALAAVARGGQS